MELNVNVIFVKACVVALKNFPAVNAEIEGEEIIYKNYYNIGCSWYRQRACSSSFKRC